MLRFGKSILPRASAIPFESPNSTFFVAEGGRQDLRLHPGGSEKVRWLHEHDVALDFRRQHLGQKLVSELESSLKARLGVRRPLIGKIINLLRKEAELVPASALPNISPIPETIPSAAAPKLAEPISS